MFIKSDGKYYLKGFDISNNDNYTYIGVNEILLRCNALMYLHINNCANIDKFGIIIKSSEVCIWLSIIMLYFYVYMRENMKRYINGYM